MNLKAQPGVTIDGKYRLLAPLGAGAMGAVWLAEQISVDRKVAIKLLHPNENHANGLDARFEIEAKAIARLNHPNCITLYDFGYSEELVSFYTVIEYVEGDVLGKRMGAPMGFDDTVSVVRQVCLGLDHAHFHNILHRDLKPDNLMLAKQSDGSELLKILDFGIAKIVNGDFGTDSGDDEIRLTKAGEVFGTPAYMSPEQARSTRELTPASDFYSLGVMLYEMIDGRLPFFAPTSFDVLMMHVTEEVPRLQRADVPEEIADVIYKLLEKHPYDRFQSGKEIIAALGSESFIKPLRIPGDGPTPTRRFETDQPTIPPQSVLVTHSPDRPKKHVWIILFFVALFSVGSIAIFTNLEPSAAKQNTIPELEKQVEITPKIEPVDNTPIERKSEKASADDKLIEKAPNEIVEAQPKKIEEIKATEKIEEMKATEKITKNKTSEGKQKTKKGKSEESASERKAKSVEKLRLIPKENGNKIKKYTLD